ncbi:acyltransferase [Hymenobacter actinosclerus]|uniref:Galactoside O-acetyltransferase n=1 Tax=Hymenobacter actinosclerus TaxID=82805 RepID=A0A1I0GWM6_9BACT|nr:acyltransferase [Hymenobacter actinosclerus]SET75774.1 galactoside O-acetyltransferase [Hymenobacter actinosclerus]
MILSNIKLGKNVEVDGTSSLNNVDIRDNVKISKYCTVFGSSNNVLHIGVSAYIGPNCFIQGYADHIEIGERVSIAQNVNIMSSSGPNASTAMQKYFPLIVGKVKIGNDCWIGANSVIMPNVVLGDFCVVAANSYVNQSFESFSVIGGNPAKLLKKLDPQVVSSHE